MGGTFMVRGFSWRHGVLLVVVALVLSFQNCSQPPDSTDGSSQFGTSYIEKLPHAYDAKMDTIAHMSCTNSVVNLPGRAYFTYRVGAYSSSTGGLSLTPAFREATKYFSVEQRLQGIQESTANMNTRLSLAIRSEDSIDSILREGTLAVGEEIESFLPALDSTSVATPLAALPVGYMVNYFPGSDRRRLMEASIRLNKYDNVVKDTRIDLSAVGATRSKFLAVGYSNSADEADQVLRKPVNGTGFKLTFGVPSGMSLPNEDRVLRSVTEYSLSTRQPVGGTWKCPSNYQFTIVRPEDKAAGLVCTSFVDRADTPAEEEALRAIRRVLRVEDWYVDVKNHCVMPRETADYCYDRPDRSVPETRKIQYGVSTCDSKNTSILCPHYVSVCLRI